MGYFFSEMFKLLKFSVFVGLVWVCVFFFFFFIPISKVAINTLFLLTLVKVFLSFVCFLSCWVRSFVYHKSVLFQVLSHSGKKMCFQKPRFAWGNKSPKLVTDHNSAVQNAQANSTRSSRNQFRDLAQSSFYPASLVSSAIVLMT